MLILIVDDNEPKRTRIGAAITDAVGTHVAQLEFAASGADAAAKLESKRFDLMILDLLLPIRTGDEPKRDGGIKFLKQLLKGGPRFQRPVHILGLTAHEDLMATSVTEFSSEGWQLIRYDETAEEWANAIQNKVRHIAESGNVGSQRYQFDLAIITALKTVELEAVLQLPADWKEMSFVGDPTYYHIGTFRRGQVSARVVAAAAIEMGMPAAATLATKLIMQCRPRYLAMAGITAGLGLKFGDIIVADQSWDYGSGKVLTKPKKQTAFAPAPNFLPLDPYLKEKAELFATRRLDLISSIQNRWAGNRVKSALSVHVGPVASGAAVVENEQAIAAIKEHNRKVIGVEMEIFGVYHAGRMAPEPRPAVFAAKSVCDFGVPPKTDEYQRYAAFTSANFIYEFFLDQLADA